MRIKKYRRIGHKFDSKCYISFMCLYCLYELLGWGINEMHLSCFVKELFTHRAMKRELDYFRHQVQDLEDEIARDHPEKYSRFP